MTSTTSRMTAVASPSAIEGLEVVQVEEEQSHRAFRVTVPAEVYGKAVRGRLAKFRREVRIRGFRKGKAPWPVIEERFAEEAKEEAARDLLRRAGRECLARFDLLPVAPVVARVESDTRGEPLVGHVEVSIHPELGAIDFKGIKVRGEVSEVTESDIGKVLENLRREHAKLGPVGSRGLVDGDAVEGDLEETELDEEGNPRHRTPPRVVPGIRLGIGENHYHPALHEALQGAQEGDTVTATVRFDAGIPDRERAGRGFRVRYTVKQALTPVLPPLDDSFARTLGAGSLLALRGDIRDKLREKHRERDEREVDSRILEEIRRKNPVTPPPGIVQQGLESEVRRMAEHFARAGRDLAQDEGALKEMVDRLRPRIEADIAYGILLDTLAEQEDIQVPPGELEAAIAASARERNETPAVVRAQWEEGHDMKQAELLLRRAATRRFLRERVEIIGDGPQPS